MADQPSLSISRRKFLALGAAGAASLPLAGMPFIRARAAQTFHYKFATGQAPTHPVNIHLAKAFERIAHRTNGQMQIQLFPANQLGTETDVISQIRSGALEMTILSASILATLVPSAGMANTAYAFTSYDEVWKAMDGPVGQYTRKQIGNVGLVSAGKIWDNGFRQCTSSHRDLKTPQDFHGFKVRVPPSPILTSFFSDIHASPTPMNFSEVYSALQTGVIEGQENALSLIYTTHLYEVQNYCALTGHSWDGYWPLANGPAWQRLPANLQKIVRGELDHSAIAQRQQVAQLDNSLQSKLAAKGMTFRKVDREAFRHVLSKTSYYPTWKKKFGPEAWGKLEAVVGKLA